MVGLGRPDVLKAVPTNIMIQGLFDHLDIRQQRVVLRRLSCGLPHHDPVASIPISLASVVIRVLMAELHLPARSLRAMSGSGRQLFMSHVWCHPEDEAER